MAPYRCLLLAPAEDLQPSSKLQTLSLQTQCLDIMAGHNGAMNSTVRGEEDGVTPHRVRGMQAASPVL